ncbi:MAG: cation-transporting P-type ATPase [Burkholderiales bacterium]
MTVGAAPPWHAIDADTALARLEVAADVGLSSSEVAKRLVAHGVNVLPEAKQRSALLVFLRQFKSPLISILFVSAALAVVMGHGSDAIVILLVVLFNALVGAWQEGRAERSMAAPGRCWATRRKPRCWWLPAKAGSTSTRCGSRPRARPSCRSTLTTS